MSCDESFLAAVGKILQLFLECSPSNEADSIKPFQDLLSNLKFEAGMKMESVIRNLKRLLKKKDKSLDTLECIDSLTEEQDGAKQIVLKDHDKFDESVVYVEEESKEAGGAKRPAIESEKLEVAEEDSKLKDESKSTPDIGELEILVRDTASLLSIQISILSNMKHFPVIPVFPCKLSIWSQTIFLFFKGGIFIPLISKEGLHDVIENNEEESKEKKVLTKIKCRCGRGNPNLTDGRCYTHENSKYITRCMCFRMQQPCTSKCDCRNCKNPHGDRPPKRLFDESDGVSAPTVKRRRYVHHHSNLSKDLTAKNFQTGAGLEVSLGKWSLAEKYLFEALISEMKTEEESLTTEIVAQKFNNVVQVATNIKGLKNIIGFKTPTQINDRLKDREKDVEEYLAMYQSQLSLLIVRSDVDFKTENAGEVDQSIHKETPQEQNDI